VGAILGEDLVLVVEDDADSRALITSVLEQELVVRTAAAANGLSALRQIWRLLPTLVVLDVCSPGVDGLQIARRLKADPCFCRIPIIVTSPAASALPGASEEALACGCDGHVTKPCDATDLVRCVRPFLSPHPATPGLPQSAA
jgi:CheY-like chemotaxis protein